MWPQWTSMLSPGQWLLLATVPPAILSLYFLKLRRQPRLVPSTYLWRRSLEDLHVNSLWQRLRQNLLLFLQLALIALAMLALLRPAWRGTRLSGDRFVFLIDNSASMSANDVAPSRLAEAQRQALALIDQLPSGAVGLVISFADRAQVEQTFTDNKKQLRSAISRIASTVAESSLAEALRVAAGLANPGRSATEAQDIQVADALPAVLYILSDGQFPDVTGFSLGNLEPKYLPIGEPQVANSAITAFSTRRNADRQDALQAYARVENFGAATVEMELALERDDRLIDAQKLSVEPGQAGAAVFDLEPLDQGVLSVALRTTDALPLDDRAWTAIEPPARSRVLVVGPENEPLRFALTTDRAVRLAEVEFANPELLETEEYLRRSRAGELQLVIYDRCTPRELPQANTLFIGRLPPGETWHSGPAVAPQIIDIETAHPLLHLIELGNVDIVEATPLVPPPGAKALLQSQAGPLLAVAPRDGYEDTVLGFELAAGDRINTNWPLRVSFPLFVLNSLEYLGRTAAADDRSYRPGSVVELHPAASPTAVDVLSPNGQRTRVERDRQQRYFFADTAQLGVYQVRDAGRLIGRFTVNLCSAAESNLAARPAGSIRIGYTQVAGGRSRETSPREAWKWLILTALVVLIGEWYIYNRRVYL